MSSYETLKIDDIFRTLGDEQFYIVFETNDNVVKCYKLPIIPKVDNSHILVLNKEVKVARHQYDLFASTESIKYHYPELFV